MVCTSMRVEFSDLHLAPLSCQTPLSMLIEAQLRMYDRLGDWNLLVVARTIDRGGWALVTHHQFFFLFSYRRHQRRDLGMVHLSIRIPRDEQWGSTDV